MLAESVAESLDRKVTNARVAMVSELADHRQWCLFVPEESLENSWIVIVSKGDDRAHGAVASLRNGGPDSG